MATHQDIRERKGVRETGEKETLGLGMKILVQTSGYFCKAEQNNRQAIKFSPSTKCSAVK